jgi:hypothetical protein
MKLDRKTLTAFAALIFSVATSVFATPPPSVCKKHPFIRPCLVKTLLSAVSAPSSAKK